MDKLEHIEKVLLDPEVEDCIRFSRAVTSLKMNESIESGEYPEEYKEVLNDTLEGLDKILFLIKQLKEGYLK